MGFNPCPVAYGQQPVTGFLGAVQGGYHEQQPACLPPHAFMGVPRSAHRWAFPPYRCPGGRSSRQRSNPAKARTGKQLDALRDDLKASEGRQREEMREMRAEQRADNKALNEKLDCFLQSMMTAKAS